MNKQEYLNELEKALKAAHVPESTDILTEYAEHFDRKLQDGYSEEEVAAKLVSPKDVAGQFGEIITGGGKLGGKLILAIGLVFADIFVGSFFVVFYAWVVILGAFAIAATGIGIIAATGFSLWNIIPEMPYICGLLLGIAFLALAVLSAFGTEYCRLYVTQMLRGYARWHNGLMGKASTSPPLPLYPVISRKKRRIMRSVTLVALVVFAVAFIACLSSMMLATKSLEPWHIWHWFQ